jgi:hypothetical protein
MATYNVGDPVWFKLLGATPFIGPVGGTGDSSANDKLENTASKLLGGHGDPTVSLSAAAKSGLSDTQGVPTIDFAAFPASLVSSAETDEDLDGTVQVSADDGKTYGLPGETGPFTGQHLGVRDQVTDNNPLAPGSVSTDGIFDGPTPKNLIAIGDDEDDTDGPEAGNNDEGRVEPVLGDGPDILANTIRDIDPNFPTGRNLAATAGGPAVPLSGSHDFVSETINLKDDVVGRRQPSSRESAGVVIELVTVKNAGITPDGTKVAVGDQLCWVNWGSSAASNPHRTKHNNRMRVSLHASADLVLAYD